MLVARRYHFILFCQQKDCRGMNRLAGGNTVELFRNLQRKRTSEQPQIPPTELTKNNLPESRRIVENQSCNRAVCRDMKRGSRTEARAKEHNWPVTCLALQ